MAIVLIPIALALLLCVSCNMNSQPNYDDGYDDGCRDGHSAAGYDEGLDEGRNEGLSNAMQDYGYTLDDLIQAYDSGWYDCENQDAEPNPVVGNYIPEDDQSIS